MSVYVVFSRAAELLDYSIRHIHRLRKAGRFPGATRVEPNGHWRFPLHEIQALMPEQAASS